MTQRVLDPRFLGRLPAVLVLSLLATTAGGCASKVYRVSQLPPEYFAAPAQNTKEADLSGLAASTVGNELITYGDVLEVTVDAGYGRDGTRTFPVRVADDGAANIPLVGRVALAGLELEGAEQTIAALAVERQIFRQPLVTVIMKRRRMNRITVIGAVEEPGVYELPRGASSLLDAIVSAGSLTDDAGSEVIIRRPPRRDVSVSAKPIAGIFPGSSPIQLTTHSQDHPPDGNPRNDRPPNDRPLKSPAIRINLVEAAQQGRAGLMLQDGDKVMVVKRDPRPVTVIGLVRKPAQYNLPANKDLRLLDVLGLAGGVSSPVADKIRIIRQVPGKSEAIIIEVGLREAKKNQQANLRLAQGDTITIDHTPATVMLETMRSFLRFGLSSSIPLF